MGRENGSNSINVDASHLVVVGDSVGGNMAAAVTLLAKERGGPNISHQVLFYPVTNANFESQSYNTYQEGYWLTREAMKWFWNNYAPDDAIRKNPLLRHCRLQSISSKGYHRYSTDENDVLRDEGEDYSLKLRQAGVTVTATRYLGTIHDL